MMVTIIYYINIQQYSWYKASMAAHGKTTSKLVFPKNITAPCCQHWADTTNIVLPFGRCRSSTATITSSIWWRSEKQCLPFEWTCIWRSPNRWGRDGGLGCRRRFICILFDPLHGCRAMKRHNQHSILGWRGKNWLGSWYSDGGRRCSWGRSIFTGGNVQWVLISRSELYADAQDLGRVCLRGKALISSFPHNQQYSENTSISWGVIPSISRSLFSSTQNVSFHIILSVENWATYWQASAPLPSEATHRSGLDKSCFWWQTGVDNR